MRRKTNNIVAYLKTHAMQSMQGFLPTAKLSSVNKRILYTLKD